MRTTTKPAITVSIKGVWTPLDSLKEEQQTLIRQKVARVVEQAIERQIAILASQPELING